MKIKALKNASKRTKDRIKNNSLDAECLFLNKGEIQHFDSIPGIAFKSTKTQWWGWLPLDEIEIED